MSKKKSIWDNFDFSVDKDKDLIYEVLDDISIQLEIKTGGYLKGEYHYFNDDKINDNVYDVFPFKVVAPSFAGYGRKLFSIYYSKKESFYTLHCHLDNKDIKTKRKSKSELYKSIEEIISKDVISKAVINLYDDVRRHEKNNL
jgi:small-conductance mechanosensitive channel